MFSVWFASQSLSLFLMAVERGTSLRTISIIRSGKWSVTLHLAHCDRRSSRNQTSDGCASTSCVHCVVASHNNNGHITTNVNGIVISEWRSEFRIPSSNAKPQSAAVQRQWLPSIYLSANDNQFITQNRNHNQWQMTNHLQSKDRIHWWVSVISDRCCDVMQTMCK